jgi:dihydrofolate reductase
MGNVRVDITMSLDGYVAGPNQSLENPLGEGGEELHEWAVALEAFHRLHGEDRGGEVNPSTPFIEGMFADAGAVIMGRNMFGGGPGSWSEEPWEGWWGDEPPYHMPVFVLTNHPREPLEKSDTTFHFVSDGIESALDQARAAAGAKDISLAGGADVINQYLAAGLVDRMVIHVAPILLGDGARLFTDLGETLPRLEQVEAVDAPGVTHITYRVLR